MALFGAAVGPGFLTRTAYPTYLVMIAWDVFVGVPVFGIVVGILYAAGRSAGVVIAAFAGTAEAAEGIPHSLPRFAEACHDLNAGLLGTFSSYAILYSILALA